MPEAANEKSIFLHAAGLAPDDRDVYLNEACRGDAAMRTRIDALLVAHDRLGGESPPTAGLDSSVPTPGPEAGTVLGGRFKLLEVIGEGGMGAVWLAAQTEPVRRKVAVKLIKPGMDSQSVLARFEAERQALALMDHPNIAKVHDAGAAPDGRPYFVMELVKGVPITRYCDDHHLTPRERLELFVPVCLAIQHAHQKGVIHRDVKPSNVLVARYDDRPVPKVIDFGVAKAAGQPLADKTLHTGFGAVVGTVEYMSPEQATFNQLDIDTRSDVYSLGVLLYELLVGSPPFGRKELEKAGVLEMLRLIREQEPSRPSTKLSTSDGLPTLAANRGTEPAKLTRLVRGELDWIVMKALEKDRTRRYETATGFALDVQRYLAGEAVLAVPPSAAYRLRKLVRRNRGPALAAAAVLLALAVGIAGTIWQAVKATREGAARLQALDDLGREQQRTGEALDQSRRLSADLAFDKGQLLGESGDANLALLWLAHSLRLAPPDAVELQAAIRTNLGAWRRQVHSLRLVLPHDGKVDELAFGRDGRIVTGCWKPGPPAEAVVRRWDPATGRPSEPLTFAGRPSEPFSYFLSPSADSVLLGFADGTIQLKDLTTGKSVWETREEGGEITSAAFSPDGKAVLIGYAVGPVGALRQAGKARLFETATGKPLGPALGHRRPVEAAAFHADGKSVVTTCGLFGNATEKAEARFWDLKGRETRAPLEYPCIAHAVTFSPDGTKLLTGHFDFKARLWDLAARHEPVVLQHEAPVWRVAFSPDGKILLTGASHGTVRLWDLSGRLLGSPLRQGHHLEAALFSPDGKSVLVGSRGNAARLWDLAVGGRAGPGETHEATFFPLAFSPDRRTILTREAGHTVQLRDAATNQPTGKPLRHQRPVLIGGTSNPPGQPQACSSDRRRALTVDADNVARLWDAQTGKLVTELKPVPESTFFAAAFSPDGKLVVTGNFEGNTAHVWHAATGRHLHQLKHERDGPVFAVAFRPGGRMVATVGADRAARFWDPATGEQLGEPLMHNSHVMALAFDPDGETVVTGDVDQSVHLWDVATRRRRLHLTGHRGGIYDAAFSPDGRLVVTGSQDQTARFWDVASGKPIGPPLAHPGPLLRVEFGRDGQTILTATQDQVARSWRVSAAVTGTAEQIELWAQAVTGMELEADGGVRILDAEAWEERRQKLAGTGLLEQ